MNTPDNDLTLDDFVCTYCKSTGRDQVVTPVHVRCQRCGADRTDGDLRSACRICARAGVVSPMLVAGVRCQRCSKRYLFGRELTLDMFEQLVATLQVPGGDRVKALAGDIQQPYEPIDTVFTVVHLSGSVSVHSLQLAKNLLRAECARLGGDVVVNCQFQVSEQRSRTGAGEAVAPVLYGYGLAVKISGLNRRL